MPIRWVNNQPEFYRKRRFVLLQYTNPAYARTVRHRHRRCDHDRELLKRYMVEQKRVRLRRADRWRRAL